MPDTTTFWWHGAKFAPPPNRATAAASDENFMWKSLEQYGFRSIENIRKLQYQYWIWWHLVEVFRSLVFFAPKFLSAGTPINLDFCGLLRLHGLCQHSWCSTCSGKILDVHHVCLFSRLINWLTRSLCDILAYVCVVTNQTLLHCVAYDSALSRSVSLYVCIQEIYAYTITAFFQI